MWRWSVQGRTSGEFKNAIRPGRRQCGNPSLKRYSRRVPMDRRKQLVPRGADATVRLANQEMSYSAEPSLGRRVGAGLFEPGHGLPASKEIHRAWLIAGNAALDETGVITSIN